MAEDTYYLTTTDDDLENGGMIAVISLGSPQKGDKKIVVCSVTRVKDLNEARVWYAEEMATKPWLTRN